jgi:hypothetical protein
VAIFSQGEDVEDGGFALELHRKESRVSFVRWPWTRTVAVAASLAIVAGALLTVRFAPGPSNGSGPSLFERSTPPSPTTQRTGSPAPGGYLIPNTVPHDCSGEASAGIMTWLAGVPKGGIARFQPNGCYLVNGQIMVSGRSGLTIDGNGSTLKRTVFLGGARIWLFNLGTDLRIQNMRIEGTDPTDDYNADNVHEHGIGVDGVQGFTVTNVTVTHVWGDCVTITHSDGNPQVPPANVSITGLTCDAGRQGVSVVVGSNISIRGNTFLGVHFDSIDLEPDVKTQPISGVVIDGNIFDHPRWEAGGELAIGGCLTTDVRITNNRDRNVPAAAAPVLIRTPVGCSSSRVTVAGNWWLLNSYNSSLAPVEVRNWTYVYVQNNTFVANAKYAYGYILNLRNTQHVWYSGNTITGPYADKWKKVKADPQSTDVHVS